MQNLSGDMISRIEYDEKEQECIAKEEQIQVNFLIYFLNYFLVFLDFTSENSSYGTFTAFKRYSSR